jgi:hypothetical protein
MNVITRGVMRRTQRRDERIDVANAFTHRARVPRCLLTPRSTTRVDPLGEWFSSESRSDPRLDQLDDVLSSVTRSTP